MKNLSESIKMQLMAGLITESEAKELNKKSLTESSLKERIREMAMNSILEKKKKKEEEVEEETPEETDLDIETDESPEDINLGTSDEELTDDTQSNSELMDSLKSSLEIAQKGEDEKLITQIENTITYLTRSMFKKN